MKLRTYRCTYWHGLSLNISATCESQARKIANAIAAKPENVKKNWKLQQIGLVIK